jgi:hypothetical protein
MMRNRGVSLGWQWNVVDYSDLILKATAEYPNDVEILVIAAKLINFVTEVLLLFQNKEPSPS